MSQTILRGAIFPAALWLLWVSAAAAQQAADKSSPAAVTAYRDAASFQNNGAFDLAAEEWQKFLKDHPQDPLAAKAQHYLGVCQLQLKQHEAAAATFAALIQKHPKFELLDDAWLNLASSQYALAAGGKAELYAKAAESFAALLKAFPKSKHVEESLYYLGESLYAQGQKAEAAAAYERLIKEFAQSKRRADALYALGVAQEELDRHADAAATYDIYLKEFATGALAGEVRMRKAETVLARGDVAAAERMFAEVAKEPNFAAADHALSRQAFCLAKLDQLAEAGAVYAQLATGYAQSPNAADAAISAGRCFYRAGKTDDARRWLEKAAAAKDGNAAEAVHWLCRILLKSGEAREAAQLAARQLEVTSEGPFVPHLKLDQADALFEMPDRRAESLAMYTRFVEAHPRHELAPQAHYNAAFAALELKQYDAGLARATAMLEAFPQHQLAPDAKYVAAECSLQLKNYEQAGRLYRELVDQHSGHADSDAWRVRLGLVAYLQKQYEATIAALSPLVGKLRSGGAQAEARFLIGASQFFLDKHAEATSSLTASLAAGPQWRQADEAMLLMARAEAKLGKAGEAQARLEKLLADFPNSALLDQAHYRLGELRYAADDFPGAIAAYEQTLARFPNSQFAPYALHGIGWSRLKSKEFAAGAESFTALLEKFSEHALRTEAQFGRALCRRQAGDAKGAIADLDAYLKTNPDRAHTSDALYERGLAQVAAGDLSGAVATLDGLLIADSKYSAADKSLYEIGWALKSQDKHAEAVRYFAKLTQEHAASPLVAEAWFHVGEGHYDQKEYDAAAKAYSAVQEKSPSGELREKTAYKLGWAHFQLEKYGPALAQFREQLAAFPSGNLAADATFMQAECLFRDVKFQEAWPAYQAALKTKPSTPTIEALTLLHAGQTAAQLKQWDESVRLLSQIAARQSDSPLLPEARYELGWAKQNLGQTAEALTEYEAAATQSRDHVGARARFMRGELLFAQKDHAAAIREFQRAMFGYGGDDATAETKPWQARSGYEAGRCAEVQINAATDAAAKQKHVADAKRFYGFVVEKHAQHELAAEARKRLESLSKL